jgi:long-chain acyl-CoA synthetase
MIARGTQDLFSPLPLYHTYGINSTVMGNMINGISITLNGDLKTMLRDMKLSGAKTLAAVPLMVEAIYKGMMNGVAEAGMTDKVKKLMEINRFLGKFGLSFRKSDLLSIKEKAGFGNFDQFVVGGAHISRELSNDLRLLGITVLQGYGITECSPLISVNSMQSCAMGSVGHVVPSVQLKFDDGEILVKGPNVMRGYYKNPELTKEAFDEDGWFRTGDLGYLDKNGFLYINGRKKNLIVCKNGNKVSPEMLEALIAPLPMVKEVLVSATTGGEGTDDVKVAASICPDPKTTAGMSSYEILEHLQKDIDAINRQLPPYQQIQMINIRETEFEKTASKKIKRNIV